VSSHSGISGNKKADKGAKVAALKKRIGQAPQEVFKLKAV
jgi:hypothetical protein